MFIARNHKSLFQELDKLRLNGGAQRCISMVSTRGNFHDGHGAVINAARTVSDAVVVVLAPAVQPQNRDNVVSALEFHDIGFIEQHNAEILYIPSEDDLFPYGFEHMANVHLPNSCDPEQASDYRLTLQLKLINLIQPDILVCGQKNYEKYHRVCQLINDLSIRTQTQCIPTVRHANGVVVDNAYESLDTKQQAIAPILYETLRTSAHVIRTGGQNFGKIEKTARLALREAGFDTKRFKILDDVMLKAATAKTTGFRIVANVVLGDIELADNVGLTL